MTTDRKPRVLVVEDDLQVVQGLVSGLSRAGFDVSVAMTGTEGASRATEEAWDVVVLDLMLPGASGFDVIEAMAGRVSTPVVILSADSTLASRVRSFALGAVDFVPKPFWMEELVARLRARLQIRDTQPRRTLTFGGTVLDLDRRVATQGEVDVGLTHHEFNVLAWLAARPGHAISRRQLVEHTLSDEGDATERTVDSHVSRIRKKLRDDAACVVTVWAIGYRLEPEAKDPS